jgi:hypothetical protein
VVWEIGRGQTTTRELGQRLPLPTTPPEQHDEVMKDAVCVPTTEHAAFSSPSTCKGALPAALVCVPAKATGEGDAVGVKVTPTRAGCRGLGCTEKRGIQKIGRECNAIVSRTISGPIQELRCNFALQKMVRRVLQ